MDYYDPVVDYGGLIAQWSAVADWTAAMGSAIIALAERGDRRCGVDETGCCDAHMTLRSDMPGALEPQGEGDSIMIGGLHAQWWISHARRVGTVSPSDVDVEILTGWVRTTLASAARRIDELSEMLQRQGSNLGPTD